GLAPGRQGVRGWRGHRRGERPTLCVGPDDTVHLAYLSGGRLLLRSRKGVAWGEAEVVPARTPAWPALAVGEDGVRLTYLGGADHGPDALWLYRRAEETPVLLPSLAGNVTGVSLVLDFQLRSSRWGYRRHDTAVLVNGLGVAAFTDTIPE